MVLLQSMVEGVKEEEELYLLELEKEDGQTLSVVPSMNPWWVLEEESVIFSPHEEQPEVKGLLSEV